MSGRQRLDAAHALSNPADGPAIHESPACAAPGTGGIASRRIGGAIGYDFNEHADLCLDVNHVRPQLFGETIRVTTTTLGFEYRF